MNRTEAVARMKEGLGFRTDLDSTCIARLQEAQRLLEKGTSLPWFLQEIDATMAGTADDGTLNLPTGFIRVVEDETFRITTSEGATRFLVRKPYDWLVQYLQDDTGDEEEGDPTYFALRSTTIEVAPVPAANYTITVSYFKAADDLGSASENVWLDNVPELLIGMAGMGLAKDLRDAAAVKTFGELLAASQAGLIREMAEREQNGREVIMGGLA